MPLSVQSVGPVATSASIGAGTPVTQRAGNMGEQIISELHGRFYEANYRSSMFSTGHTAAFALVAANATATGLTSTAQPVLGVYNPSTSTVNLVIAQIALQDFLNNVTSVALGAWVLCVTTGQTAISTGLAPWNRKSLAASGSAAKGFAGATALTGMTGSLTVQEAIELPQASGLLTTTIAAATPTPSVGSIVNFDGSLIVPPGGVLALMNTLSVTTHSVYGRLLWEEVPV